MIILRSPSDKIEINLSGAELCAESKLDIVVASGVTVDFIERGHLSNPTSMQINLTLAEATQTSYTILPDQHSSPGLTKRFAKLAKNATLTWYDMQMSVTKKLSSADKRSKIANEKISDIEKISEIITELAGEGASSYTYGVSFGRDGDRHDIRHVTIHSAPRTRSQMLIRGILDDSVQVNYHGSIQINPGVPGCHGQERADFLILSPQARVQTLPELEIGNNDVHCSHATTITRLDPERLFYLASRGLNKKNATELLVEAHLAPVLCSMSLSQFHATLQNMSFA